MSGPELEQERKPLRRRGPSRTSGRVPAEVRSELDEQIARQRFGGYRELQRWLALHGCTISRTAARRGGLKLEEKLAAVRMATEQARAVAGASDLSDTDMSQALMRLVQQQLFSVLIEVGGADLAEVNLGALARSVAELARASIAQQKFAAEMREHAESAQRLMADAERHGLSEAGVAQIRRALMAITEQ